jgi:NAD(P)H-dependent FMN reductase
MARLTGFAGSLRRSSYNRALLEAAAGNMPAGSSLDVLSIADIPLYDADREAEEGIPDAVARLQERIAGSDGLVIASPEYNNSIPGVAKNVVDWLSRPPQEIGRIFGGRPVALIGASPGGFGTVLAQAAWLPVLRTLGMRVWPGPRIMVSRAHERIDEGRLTDEKTRERLQDFMQGFVDFVEGRADA